MEFKQLEAFAAVVEYNSFSEAARRLYLTQPTVSAHIRALETELNSRLIIRSTQKVSVTARGYQLYDSRPAQKLKHASNIINKNLRQAENHTHLTPARPKHPLRLPAGKLLNCVWKKNPGYLFSYMAVRQSRCSSACSRRKCRPKPHRTEDR